MVLRVRKRPGMEAEDVLAAPRTAGGSGGSVWGKLIGGGTKPAAADGARSRRHVEDLTTIRACYRLFPIRRANVRSN